MRSEAARPTAPAPPRAPGEFPPELRRGLRDGERRALAKLFDAYFDRVYDYARRLLREDHLAEDVSQEVFLRVHRARGTYEPERDPRAWLFAIATNLVRQHWRSRSRLEAGRGLPMDLEELARSPGNGTETRAGGVSGSELLDHMRAAVEDLPRGMRTVVLLRAYEGFSFEAVGEVLGLTPAACRKRYSRALGALRERLGARYDPANDGRPT